WRISASKPKGETVTKLRSALLYCAAFILAFIIFELLSFPLYWLLVRFQTWRLGHPNPFAFGPAMDAAISSSFVAGVAFGFLACRGPEWIQRWHWTTKNDNENSGHRHLGY